MIGLIINCNGEVMQCKMDIKTKSEELDTQIEAVFDKYESILPRFNDNIGNIKNSLPSQDVVDLINKQDNMMIKNLFPPVNSCCGKQLRMEKPTKVVIFEKLACWNGFAFTAKCNICHIEVNFI